MPSAVVFAVSAANRWLAVFSVVALVVLGVAALARRAARRTADDNNGSRAIRRRAGALVALGPLIGLALAPSPGTLTVVAALGAVALAGIGLLIEPSPRADRLTMTVSIVAAGVATVAGAEFGPTGVPVLDVVFGFLFVLVVTQAADGLGNVDGLAPGLGTASAAGLFALAAFGAQDDLATVALGLSTACFAFLAFNLRPASLYIGRAGRLAIGYSLAVGVLAVDVGPERAAPARHATPARRGLARRQRGGRPRPAPPATVTRDAPHRSPRAPTGGTRLVDRRGRHPPRARAGRPRHHRRVRRPCRVVDLGRRRGRRGRDRSSSPPKPRAGQSTVTRRPA